MRELGSMLRIDLDHLRGVFLLGGLMAFFWVIPGLLLGMLGEGRQSFSISVPLLSLFLVVLMLVLFQVGRVERADILYDILPLRRRTVIISGYLVLLVLSFLFEIAVAAMMLAMPMAGVNVGADWPVAVLVSLVAALFGFAIAAPLIVRFGGRNGGIVIFSILAVTALGVDAMGHAAFPGAPPPLLTGWLPLEGLWVLLAAGLAAYAVSLLVSIRIYERQDH